MAPKNRHSLKKASQEKKKLEECTKEEPTKQKSKNSAKAEELNKNQNAGEKQKQTSIKKEGELNKLLSGFKKEKESEPVQIKREENKSKFKQFLVRISKFFK
ncbi:hypothetical protein ECANGB1_968 [Enterospora canceri]|uniref:Uncharacterized protein n=1 Tax=Enterospora canceri TaxID=1081671 RepID=A0A1Y1S758_9MICR|nr:hypothetical protein ECANGB1_968 [Enterospora canceri]